MYEFSEDLPYCPILNDVCYEDDCNDCALNKQFQDDVDKGLYPKRDENKNKKIILKGEKKQ